LTEAAARTDNLLLDTMYYKQIITGPTPDGTRQVGISKIRL